MAEENFEFKVDNAVFRTGMKTPTTFPLSFVEYPAADLYDLNDMMKILSNPKRKSMGELYPHRYSQGQVSSCNSFAACTALSVAWNQKNGKHVDFEPCSHYHRICGGRDEGSLLDEGMRELVKGGACLKGSWTEFDWSARSMNMEKKRHAEQEAMDHRALDVYQFGRDPDTVWKAMLSAICRRDPSVFAIHCDDNFFRTGADGMIKPARGPGNHAVLAIDAKQFGTGLRDIKLLMLNSHGKRWAMNGCGWVGFDSIAQTASVHAFYAIRSVRLHPEDKIRTLLAA